MSEQQPQPGEAPPGFYIPLPRVAELVGVSATHVHRLHKEGALLAVQDRKTKRWWVDGESVRQHIQGLQHANNRERARLADALAADEFRDEAKRLARNA